MIIPKKKTALSSTARSPDSSGPLYLDSTAGWNLDGPSGEAALKVSAVYRCINFNAETISLMPFFIADQQWNRLKDHPLLDPLCWRPNECMTPADYKFVMQVNRDLKGNAYAYIGRNARTGRVEELLPLCPDLVQPVFDKMRNLHYLYTDPISGKVYDLMPSQVIHYKAFTLDGINGVSPLTYARDVIAKDKAAKAYERAIYNNGGRPSGVLYTDTDLAGVVTVTKADGTTEVISKKEQIRRAWERVHAGGDNAFRTAVLDHGLKYQAIAMNNSDAQFVESNDITIADIARFFGTPLHVLMAGKQSYESNMQNRIEFIQTTALAIVNRCEDEDSYKLLRSDERASGFRICRDMNAALRGDTESRSRYYREMTEIGAFSVDDVREQERLSPVPGGSVRRASLNYVPLEDFRELSRKRNGGKNETQSE